MDNINGVNHIHPFPAVEAGMKVGQRIAVDLSDPQDTVEFTTEKKPKEGSNAAKKVGAGIASLMVPGFGQLVNGNAKGAAGHFFGYGAALAGAVMTAAACPPLAVGLAVGAAAIDIHGVVDAVMNA